ncbi:MAG: tetratricopeptide repeat protein [Microcystis panniformis]
MNPKFYALLTLSLVATVSLPVVNGKLSSLVPAVVAQNTNARETEADRLFRQGLQQFQNNQFREALQSWEKALQIYREIKDRPGEAISLGNLGLAYYSLGQHQLALKNYEQALLIFREIKNRDGEASTLNDIGLVYSTIRQPRKALEYYQKTLSIRRELGDRQNEADALNNIGALYDDIGQPGEALKYLQQALSILRKLSNLADGEFRVAVLRSELTSLNNIANVYLGVSQKQKGLEYMEQTLPILRELGDRPNEAVTLSNMGFLYGDIEAQKALDYSLNGLKILRELLRELNDRRVESDPLDDISLAYLQRESAALNNLGLLYLQMGQPQKALEYYREALSMSQLLKYPVQAVGNLNGIGEVYHSIGQLQKALEYLEQALSISQEINDSFTEGLTQMNIGGVYADIGQPQKALEYYQKALSMFQQIDHPGMESATFNLIGSAYRRLGQPQKALEYYQNALFIQQLRHENIGQAYVLNNIGGVYLDIGQPQKALEYYQQALPISRRAKVRVAEARILNGIGLVYFNLGKPTEALNYYQQALSITREIGDRQWEAASLNNLGVAYQKINQPAEAIKNLEASLNIILKIRGDISRENIAGQNRKSFLASNERTVITLAEVLIQQNQPEKAFQWLNLATTADLADYNRLIDAKVADPDAQKALDNWNTDNQQLEGMRRQLQDKYLEELAQQIRQFEEKVYKNAETIGQKYPEIAELFETKPTDIAQLQKNIAPDTLVIQPVPLRDKVALFLVTREKLIVIQSDAKRDELNKLVSEYRTQLADYKNADYLVTGSKLYEILIRPIESQIATSSRKNIAIIATGQLRYIPFETLYDKKNDQVLLEKYPIYYLTRISTSTPPATERKPLQGLAFANPKPTQEELKGTEIEAETISKLFPGSEKYLGTNATLDIFKKQAFRFSILHLGTHGCFDLAGCPNLGMEPNTILFANKEQYNIADAALLGLKDTELITLSACQTAKEANADGQEISGLAYVLERAGAKSVIASLWSAEDNTSAEIMTQFYQNLKNGMTKSEAMQKAKLSQIKSHPFFWSPFILIGAAN